MTSKRRVRISGTGSFLPEKVLTNADFEKMLDTSDEWITTRTGIKERHIVDNGVATSDLACQASMRALENAGLLPEQLDLIILASISPDTTLPAGACWLQAKLGAFNAGAFDITAACSGFVYASNVAWQFIANGRYNNILVVGAECLSKITNYRDRSSCILFGDGAGAAVFSASDSGPSEILYGSMGADGRGAEIMILPACGSRKRASHETIDSG